MMTIASSHAATSTGGAVASGGRQDLHGCCGTQLRASRLPQAGIHVAAMLIAVLRLVLVLSLLQQTSPLCAAASQMHPSSTQERSAAQLSGLLPGRASGFLPFLVSSCDITAETSARARGARGDALLSGVVADPWSGAGALSLRGGGQAAPKWKKRKILEVRKQNGGLDKDGKKVKKTKRGRRGGKRIQEARDKHAAKPLPEDTEMEVKGLAQELAEAFAQQEEEFERETEDDSEAKEKAIDLALGGQFDFENAELGGETTSLFLKRNDLMESGPQFRRRLTGAGSVPEDLTEYVKPNTWDELQTGGDLSIVDAVAEASNDQGARVFLQRGHYHLETNWNFRAEVDADSRLDLRGEEGAVVWGEWLFLDESAGNLSGCAFVHESMGEWLIDEEEEEMPGKHDEVLFLVKGGPWNFEGCAMRSVGGDALSTKDMAEVMVTSCQLGGIGGAEMCAMNAALLRGHSNSSFMKCTFEYSGSQGGANVACQKHATAHVSNSTLKTSRFAVTMKGRAELHVQDSVVMLNGVMFNVKGEKASLSVSNTVLQGEQTWADFQEPKNYKLTAPENACKEFLRGRCKRGSECKFWHSVFWAKEDQELVV